MWHRLLYILPIILSASSIKVPVDNQETATELLTVIQEEPKSTPIYYIKDEANVDSYLVPPDPHTPDESFSDALGPATFLTPPAREQRSDFYISPLPSAQSDWLPILQAQTQNQRNARFQRPMESIPIFITPNQPENEQNPIPVPSTQLVPPSIDAVNEYFVPVTTKETELHVDAHNQPIQAPNYNLLLNDEDRPGPTVNPHFEPAEPTIPLHLIPPRPQQAQNPSTQLYPKKYPGEFKPVPIPLAQYYDDKQPSIPKAKPVKYFKPQPSAEIEQFTPSDDKKLYHYKKAENQRKLKGEENSVTQHHGDAAAETYGEPTSTEQETSETNFRYPERNVYSAPLRQATPVASPPQSANQAAAPAPDGRTEFRMHGMKGPHSYQFGYDTGKGKNRQFRYEERDNDGLVHGHYGYVDKLGKLRVVNYSAHPEYGFRAEEPVEKE